MTSTLAQCRPPLWAPNGHAQTIVGFLLPSPSLPPDGEAVEISLPDGDRLVGLLYPGTKPVVVAAFHGLSGCSDSRYMRRTAWIARRLGYSCFLMNHRGCGLGKGKATHPYHSGRAEDLSAALSFLKDRLPGHKRIAVGFSLSGNALLLLLSGERGTEMPEAGISVNAPIRLDRAAEDLRRGFNRVYDRHFVRLCQRSIQERRDVGLIGDQYKMPRGISLMEFDDYYTAPAGGFRDRFDYYDSCSAAPRLGWISKPTVMLTAKDDPFVDYRDYTSASLPPTVKLHLEANGGHMGYLTRGANPHWLDLALEHYLQKLATNAQSVA